MERFMVHLENSGYAPPDARRLLGRARKLCAGMDILVRDSRVSPRHIEYDISVNDVRIESVIERLAGIGGLLSMHHLVEEDIPKERAIRNGVAYFEAERFWESHEALEGAWMVSDGAERTLLQGLILAAAGLVHHQKGNDARCLSIFGRSIAKLDHAGMTGYSGIDVASVRKKMRAMISSGRVSTFNL